MGVAIIGIGLAWLLARKPKNICDNWHRPIYREIPQDVLDRSWQLKDDLSIPLWSHIIEPSKDGRLWRYNVVIHGMNDIVPFPHRGVDVEVCLPA